MDIEEGIREVEFLLSSVRRERSRNLPPGSSEGPARPLLSDIERQIRQLERGQHSLAQVILALRALGTTKDYQDYEAPLAFQARVEVRHRHSRAQRTSASVSGQEDPTNQLRARKNSVSRLLQSANRYFSRQSSSSVSPQRTAKSSPTTPTTPTSLTTSSSTPTSPSSSSSRQDGCGAWEGG